MSCSIEAPFCRPPSCILPPPSLRQRYQSHKADSVSAQLFYSTQNQPWIRTGKYDEWFVVSSAAEQKTIPWLWHLMHGEGVMQVAGRSHKVHPKNRPSAQTFAKKQVSYSRLSLTLLLWLAQHQMKLLGWWGLLKSLQYQLCLCIACPCSTWRGLLGICPS